MSSKNKVHKTMRLPQELIDQVKKQAQEEYRSFNNMLEVLLARGIESSKK